MPTIDHGRIQAVLNAYLGNPFSTSERARREGEEALLQLEAPVQLSLLLGVKRHDRAEQLLLALAHRQARRGPGTSGKGLDEPSLPKQVQALLPRPRTEYVRIALAAGRAHRALEAIQGTSTAAKRLREATWAACFGESLFHALELARVIRDHDVLLLGETGTGKELVANAIQEGTPGGEDGKPAPKSAINAAALPETLVESELFGHAKGAFTGAAESRAGRIRTADKGTFFLDEVGDLPQSTQVKLLRVIENDEVHSLGSDTAHQVDVRFVAATHKNLAAMVARGEFRHDLYQRLAGNVLHLPPLRERPEDVPPIGSAFVRAYLGPTARPAQLEAVDGWLRAEAAQSHPWPGNVRQLQNALRNFLLGLDPGLSPSARPPEDDGLPVALRDGTASEAQVVEWYQRRVVAKTKGNLAAAARVLGVDRSTLRRRAKGLPLS
ncbi:MAG: sigma 54-interacting transcriptional regulator [Myxococcota bacterium]